MIRKFLSTIKSVLLDLKRQMQIILKLKSHVLIGYTKKHPIFTDLFEINPPQGYIFYIRSSHKILYIIDQFIWSKIRLLHLDAASPKDPSLNTPIIVECEGRPRQDFFLNDQIKVIFVESKWAAQEHISHKKVRLLYPSVAIPEIEKINFEKDPEFIHITAVGYGGMVKGFDVVFKIYQTLKKEYKVKLLLAGTFGHNYEWYPEITKDAYDKANFSYIEKELKKDPNVEFGPVKRKKLHQYIYPKTNIYLHLSRLETFGYSVLEAMSFGIPVVATNLHAIPEMVEDGKTGFLVNDFSNDINSEEWFDQTYKEALNAIKSLIDNPELRIKMGRNSHQKVKEKFDINIKRKKVEEVYNSILQ